VLTHKALSPECRTASSRNIPVSATPPIPANSALPPALTPPQLKKALIASGFEVFRTLPEEVVLAERVRENLILDSGVRVGPLGDGSVRVRLVLRAQRADFPSDEEATLFERVRKLAEPALADGFNEVSTNVNAVKDPADPDRTLDTFYEVFLAREVATLEDAVPILKFALGLEKAVAQATPRT
jgi:hypothetical protein